MEEISKSVTIGDTLPTLSVCMIVKDGEVGLLKLLPEIKNSVDEIILVNTGSNDNTKQIAIDNGAKVYDYIWNNDFAKARNESLKYATKDFIMFLDDDDFIKRDDLFVIKSFLGKNKNCGVYLRLLDHLTNNEITESTQLRIFPNYIGAEFRGKIHEQVSYSLQEKGVKLVFCNATVNHYGYEKEEDIGKKLIRNFEALKEQVKENPNDFSSLVFLARTALAINQFSIAKNTIDKAITLFKEGKCNLTQEPVLVAYITRAIIYDAEGKTLEAYKLLESIKHLFPNDTALKLTIGEILFKLKKYDKVYKEIIFFRNEKLNIGPYPMNVSKVRENMRIMLLASALYVGDFKTAEICMKKAISDPNYKIKK